MEIRVVQAGQVNEDDRVYYQENGCVIVRGLYSQGEIDAAKQAVEKTFRQPGQAERLGDRKSLSIVTQFSQTDAEWRLFYDPDLQQICKTLTGWRKLYWEDSTGTLVVSWPQKNDWTGMHLDFTGSGHQIAQGESKVYGLIYLDDSNDADCGRTKVVLGSHKLVRNHLQTCPDDLRNDMLYDDVSFFGFDDPIPVNTQAGDILLFDYLLAHSSGGQRKDTPRIVLRVGFHNGMGQLANEKAHIPHLDTREVFDQTDRGKNLRYCDDVYDLFKKLEI